MADHQHHPDQPEQVTDRLERLWAPYRQLYIGDPERKKNPDPFTEVPTMEDVPGNIVARGELVYVVLNKFPYNAGHLLVVPYRKVAELEDLTDEETAELMVMVKAAIRTLKLVSHPAAFNVGFNLGRASGGSVAEHLHMHVVPRWPGDSSFMTVIDTTKILGQALRKTRNLLAEHWDGPGATVVEDEPVPLIGDSGTATDTVSAGDAQR